MVTVHMICGFLGSGKTTFAKQLECSIPGVRFSTDEWMITLFGHRMTRAEFDGRTENLKELIWKLCRRLIALEIDIILDFGFWSRLERDTYRKRITEAGAAYRLYYLDHAPTELRIRVQNRNKTFPDGLFVISDEAFDEFWPKFEPPTPDELEVK